MKGDWISSDGGPLICATPSALSEWRGVSGSSSGSARTDYERACDESEYLGVIPCGSHKVLVLGDEPLQSTFARTADGVVIVRWVSCLSGDRADKEIASLPSRLLVLGEPQQLLVNEPRLCLFDAALVGGHSVEPASCTDIEPGHYEITTEQHKREQEFDFLIHRFRRLPAG